MFSKRTIVIGIGLLLAIIVAGLGMVASATSFSSVARRIEADCAGPGDHSPCYESEVPALYPKLSVSQIFDVVRQIRADDSSYQFCHVLAHKIGERVVAEDPDKWVDAIPLNPPDGYCSNGFIHGVIGGRFRAEVLDDATLQKFLPDFKRACEPHDGWNPSDLDKAVCYHGMGHLYDFITNANLNKALSLCGSTVPDQFRRVCVEGVFMQIYQPLEPDDYALIAQMPVKPTKTTVRQFCATFKDPEYVGACLNESWPMHDGMTDGTGVADFCSGQPNAELTDHCYQSAFSIMGRLLLAKPDDAAHACSVVPAARQELCYSVIADTILEEDRSDAGGAVAFCQRGGAAVSNSCMAYLIQTAQFNFGTNTEEYTHFCAALPDTLQTSCRATNPTPNP
jgi:hypothetical protein